MYRRWHPWERPPREPASKRHTPNCKSNRAWDQRDPRWSGRHKCVTVIRGSIRSSYIRYTKVAGYNNLPFLSMDHIPFETYGSCIWIGAMDRQGIWEWGLFYKPIPKKNMCCVERHVNDIMYIYICTYWSYYYMLLLSFWIVIIITIAVVIYCSAFLPDSLYMSIQVQVHETVDKRKHWPFFSTFSGLTLCLCMGFAVSYIEYRLSIHTKYKNLHIHIYIYKTQLIIYIYIQLIICLWYR